MLKPTLLPNTFILEGRMARIYTRSLTPGVAFFEQESAWKEGGVEYRELSPRHSKLAAALAKGCQRFGLQEGSHVLYLGASHGYTPSFVSDMVGAGGLVHCVEFSPVVMRDLVFVCEARANMSPILASAAQPREYAWRCAQVDVVFQDIAQRDQLGIFLRNVAMFLKSGGTGMLALKARSIDTSRRPDEIFRDIKRQLGERKDVTLIDYRELAPFEKDHAFFVVKKR